MLGKAGFVEVANQCLSKAEYLKEQLQQVPGVELSHGATTFNEFAITLPKPAAEALTKLRASNIIGGLDLGRWDNARSNQLLIAVTERHTRAELDAFVTAVKNL